MTLAGRDLLGDEFTMEGIDFAGRLDPWIWRAACHNHAVRFNLDGALNAASMHDEFRAHYGHHLEEILEQERTNPDCPGVQLLPGIASLIDRLDKNPEVTLGLLTGNYPETGRLKITAAGINPQVFVLGAFGDDVPDSLNRDDLPPVAISRYKNIQSSPANTTILGDTIHDIQCAKTHACRALGVATGYTSKNDLIAAGADLALDDLSDVDAVAVWLTDGE